MRTLMQLKRELAMVGLSTTLMRETRESMAARLCSILVSMLWRRGPPSWQRSMGPLKQQQALSSILGHLLALSKSSWHLRSQSLYSLRCSFSCLTSSEILRLITLNFLATSSQAFFSASFRFSCSCPYFFFISATSRFLCSLIFFTIPSLNSALLVLQSRMAFLERNDWNSTSFSRISSTTSFRVFRWCSRWVLKRAQCGQIFTQSVRQMISCSFLCNSQKVLSPAEGPELSSVSGQSSFSGLSRQLFSLRTLLRAMFLGKFSSSTSWRGSSCPQSWHSMVVAWEARRCLRQQVQVLWEQWGIMRGWLAAVKAVLQRQQTNSSSLCIKQYHSNEIAVSPSHTNNTELNRTMEDHFDSATTENCLVVGGPLAVATLLLFSLQLLPCLTIYNCSISPAYGSTLAFYIFGRVNIWSMEPSLSQDRMHRISKLVNHSHQALQALKILIVGVGGIGCEILKVLAKAPIGEIHILDMDTIEISNLNRQFLFKTCHKGMSKSLVARETILKLNPSLNIQAHHTNIKDLPIAFFRQFGFLVMALDNIEARNYVNRIGIRLDIPIVDAGTLAYKGNATTILRGLSKCYSCEPKASSQKSFPVCTIRMRPEKPIHCIVWAKMLFEAMFGGNEENDLSDLGELGQKDALSVLTQLFLKEIEDIKNAKSDTDNKLTELFVKNIRSIPQEQLAECANKTVMKDFHQHDQVQSTETSIGLFVEALGRLKKERGRLGAVVFEKDDDDIIHFITAAANLRMCCFGIPQQSFNEVKNMAGNIVPAIASTNSIVSGIEVIQMLKLLRDRRDNMRSYFIQNLKNKVVSLKLEAPLPTCSVCSPKALPVTFECDFNKVFLKDLVSLIREKSPSLVEFSLNQGEKEIYNTEEPREVLLNKTIFQLSATYEFDLILTDEEAMRKVCSIWVLHKEQALQIEVSNSDKLVPAEEEGKMEAEPSGEQNGKEDRGQDSDVVIFGQEDSPQLQIVQPMKRERAAGQGEVTDELRKKKKME